MITTSHPEWRALSGSDPYVSYVSESSGSSTWQTALAEVERFASEVSADHLRGYVHGVASALGFDVVYATDPERVEREDIPRQETKVWWELRAAFARERLVS